MCLGFIYIRINIFVHCCVFHWRSKWHYTMALLHRVKGQKPQQFGMLDFIVYRWLWIFHEISNIYNRNGILWDRCGIFENLYCVINVNIVSSCEEWFCEWLWPFCIGSRGWCPDLAIGILYAIRMVWLWWYLLFLWTRIEKRCVLLRPSCWAKGLMPQKPLF